MEKIREAFKSCLDLTPVEQVVMDDGVHEFGGTLPIVVPYILRAFALMLYIDAAEQTGEEINEKIAGVLQTSLNMNSLMQGVQLGSFLRWWLDQDAVFDDPDENGEYSCWYEFREIVDKWNEWAVMENNRTREMLGDG